MENCRNCGAPLDENVTFCKNCGYKTTKAEEIKPQTIKKKTYKLPIIVLIIAILFLGIILGKDTIMYNYYVLRGNKETSIPQSIEYYTSALKLNYEESVIIKISEKIKQDDNFEEILKTIEPVIKSSDLEKIYKDMYVKKAKENFIGKNYETTINYLAKAQNYGYNIEDFEYYQDLEKALQETDNTKTTNQTNITNIIDPNYTNDYNSNGNNFYGDYIIYDSSTRYLTREELSYYSKNNLALIRNEIFARHGYMFNKQKYRDYFMSKSWYTPDPSFKGGMQELNQIERANVELIKKLER